MKKLICLALALVLVLSFAACTSSGTTASSGTANAGTDATSNAGTNAGDSTASYGKVVIWTNNGDLEKFGKRYTEETGREVEVLVIDGGEYMNKINTTLGAKSSDVDIIVGEPQMLLNFYEAGYLEDIGSAPYNGKDSIDELVNYVGQIGTDSNGVLRALAYQTTPGMIFYRRDLWQEVYGNDSPEFVESKTKDFATILTTAREVKEKGYRLIPDAGTLRRFANDEAWIKDGNTLVMTDKRMQYFDNSVAMYQEGLTADCPEWSAAWFASMYGEMPINVGWEAADSDAYKNAETTQVMMYAMASWGAGVIRESVKEQPTYGKFGVAKAPAAFTEGGGYVGINTYSKNKDAAWEFIKYVCLTESTYDYWIEETGGDMVAMKSAIEKHKDDEFPLFANQKTYPLYLESAERIDLSTVTKYDDSLKEFFGIAIQAVQTGELSKEAAIAAFYETVKTTYPELVVPQ